MEENKIMNDSKHKACVEEIKHFHNFGYLDYVNEMRFHLQNSLFS